MSGSCQVALSTGSAENILIMFEEADLCFSKQTYTKNSNMGSKKSDNSMQLKDFLVFLRSIFSFITSFFDDNWYVSASFEYNVLL